VGDCDEAFGRFDANRLRIQESRVAGGGVARVADRHPPGQLLQNFIGEDLRHKTHALDVGEVLSIGCSYAGRFLSAVL
jgi:hypothetical protein